MDITEVRVSLRDDQKLKAFVSITLDDCFVIRGLKIIEGADGMFVAMPSRKRKDGDYQDVAHPINNKTRAWMEEIILNAYKEECGRSKKLETSGAVRSTDMDDF
jgi:stage V sporulation protein G